MDELLTLARQLRPTALDDHGLVAALASQVADFGQRARMHASFRHTGAPPVLSDEEQLVIYRVTQESLSNIAQHAGACVRRRGAELRRATCCASATTGAASTPGPPAAAAAACAGGRAASGCRACGSARCWSAGASPSSPRAGAGTTIELTMGAT